MERLQLQQQVVQRLVSWSWTRDAALLRSLDLFDLVQAAREVCRNDAPLIVDPAVRCAAHPHLTLRCQGCAGAAGGKKKSRAKTRAARENAVRAGRANRRRARARVRVLSTPTTKEENR
jgi:hypothetical protein